MKPVVQVGHFLLIHASLTLGCGLIENGPKTSSSHDRLAPGETMDVAVDSLVPSPMAGKRFREIRLAGVANGSRFESSSVVQ